MKSILTLICLLGLLGFVRVSAEPLIEGRVRLDSGEPVADAQVRLFDLTDLGREAVARATTDGTGYFALPLAALAGSVLPEGFALGPNYPNPFNPSTIIPYQLAASSQVRLEVFNLLGQRIATLVDGERPAGFHTATWHATDATGRAVGAGVYIYRMTVGVKHQTGRMVLIDGQAGVSAGGTASVLPGESGGSGPDGEGAQVYGLIVSGSGLVPYVDSAFRVEAGMAPVELVVSAGLHSAGKATDDDAQVVIPDAKLRAAIETVLGKASGATITVAEMATLATLDAKGAGISDLTGLEFAVNLRFLSLYGNNISDISPLRSLTNLTYLRLRYNRITDLSPLAGLTNLTWLYLNNNTISDLSPLAGLTNLTELVLHRNTISDLSPLAGLTNLRSLGLRQNNVSDLSPLAGLTNLRSLYFNLNNITDVSLLSRLTKLESLDLTANNISDLSPLRGLSNLRSLNLTLNNITNVSSLSGLTNLTELHLRGNLLSLSSINDHIPSLKRSGVTVHSDPFRVVESDFDIELVFDDDGFTQAEKRIIQYAARRWMSIIREDLPDYNTSGWSSEYNRPFSSGELIDDLGIHVTSVHSTEEPSGWASVSVLRSTSSLPVLGHVTMNLYEIRSSSIAFISSETSLGFLGTAIHEIGHALGSGTIWDDLGFLQDPNGDAHFNGPLAIAAFNDAGGRDYTGAKVPVAGKDRGPGTALSHWSRVLNGELMGSWSSGTWDTKLSAISIQSLADLGYVVDVTQAVSLYHTRCRRKGQCEDRGPILSCTVGVVVRHRPTPGADLRS